MSATPATASGRWAASASANSPPMECPTRTTFRPTLACTTSSASRASAKESASTASATGFALP
jgi:hypothetical protein